MTPWYKALHLRPRKEFWSVVMMIRIRGENGSRGNGRRRRGMERGIRVYDFLYERAYLPQPFPSDPVFRCTWVQISPKT